MKGKLFLGLLFAAMVLILSSCPNPVTEEMLLHIRDITGPVITITSPVDGSSCAKTVVVTGAVSDTSAEDGEAGEVRAISWEVLSADLHGDVTFDEEGAFSFSFETAGLASSFVLKVRAVDWNGNSGYVSITLNLVAGNDIPSFSAAPGNRQVTLTWDEVPYTESYDLYYTTTGALPSESFGIRLKSVTSPYTLSDLENGTMCVFRLKAVPEEDHPENWSGYEWVIPLSELMLTPIVIGGNRVIDVSWPSIPATDEFDIWKSINPDSGFTKISGSYSGNTFTDNEVETGTFYYYSISPSLSDEIRSLTNSAEADPFIAEPALIGSAVADLVRSYRQIALQEQYAYMLDTLDPEALTVVDISNREFPQARGTVELPDANDAAVFGSYACVAAGSAGLVIISTSDPDNPAVVKTVATSGYAADIEISGGYAFVGVGSSGFDVIDIDPIGSAHKTGSVTSCGTVSVMAVSGTSLFTANTTTQWEFDITNPESIPAGNSDSITFDHMDDMTVAGTNRLYIGRFTSETEKLNIVDASGTRIGSLSMLSDALAVAAAGNYAYVADYHAGLEIVNVSNPSSPSIAYTVDTPASAWDTAVADGYAYVADGSRITVIAVGIPSPEGITDTETASRARGVTLSETHAYLADSDGGLKIFDISVPGSLNPPLTTVPAAYAWDTAVFDDYAFVADDDGLIVVDIGTPGSAAAVTTVTNATDLRALTVYGSYVYALSSLDKTVVIYDISDPEEPEMVKTLPISESPRDIAVSGNYAYVAAYNDPDTGNSSHLWIIDISNPESAKILKKVTTESYVEGVAISGNYAYLAENNYFGSSTVGFTVVNIENPSAASVVGSIDTTEVCTSVAASGSYAYVGESDAGLTIMSLSDPTAPSIVTTVPASVSVQDVAVSGTYAYVADWTGGFHVIDLLPE